MLLRMLVARWVSGACPEHYSTMGSQRPPVHVIYHLMPVHFVHPSYPLLSYQVYMLLIRLFVFHTYISNTVSTDSRYDSPDRRCDRILLSLLYNFSSKVPIQYVHS